MLWVMERERVWVGLGFDGLGFGFGEGRREGRDGWWSGEKGGGKNNVDDVGKVDRRGFLVSEGFIVVGRVCLGIVG